MKIYNNENGNRLVTGEAAEIKAVYRALRRAWERDRYSIGPSHLDLPVLVDGRVYGIEIVPDERTFWVLNASSCMRALGC